MIERQLYAPIIKGAKRDGWLLFRIVDDQIGRKPFDITGLSSQGKGIALECKLVRTHINHSNPLGQASFERHQPEWLDAWAAKGGIALVLIHFELENQTWLYQWPKPEYPHMFNMQWRLQWKRSSGAILGWPNL